MRMPKRTLLARLRYPALAFAAVWAALCVVPLLPLLALLAAVTAPAAGLGAAGFILGDAAVRLGARLARAVVPGAVQRRLAALLARVLRLADAVARRVLPERIVDGALGYLTPARTTGSPVQVWSSSLDVDDLVTASNSPDSDSTEDVPLTAPRTPEAQKHELPSLWRSGTPGQHKEGFVFRPYSYDPVAQSSTPSSYRSDSVLYVQSMRDEAIIRRRFRADNELTVSPVLRRPEARS